MQIGHMKQTINLVLATAFSIFTNIGCNGKHNATDTLAETEESSLSAETENIDENMKTLKTESIDTTKTGSVELPRPAVELPTLSFDKKNLSKVLVLDEMIIDAEIVSEASKKFTIMLDELKAANQYGSLSDDGTLQGKLKVINKVADSFTTFDATGRRLGEKVLTFVKGKYDSDSEFSSKYSDVYREAEAQLSEMILNNELRRKVSSELSTFYKYTAISTYAIENGLAKADELKTEVVSSLLSGVNTGLLVSDYKKDKELTDLLNGSRNTLSAMQRLNPSDSDKALISKMMIDVDKKWEKRINDIAKSREEYRFPSRYSSGNTPADAAQLEQKMEAYLEKSFYDGKNKYDVRKIVVAGPWVEVKSILGVVMYYQIDFYVAVKYKDSNAGLLDVALVTGKTSSVNTKTFTTYSIGSIGQMYDKNLK
jgi:hypothetical protein